MIPETSNDADSKPQPSEITALTAVHIANALIMHEDYSFDTTSFPYVDMSYLETLGLTHKLHDWIDLYENSKELSKEKIVV